MACNNYSGCSGQVVSDNCIKYTGSEIPLLNICTGDTLNKIETIILDKITEFAKGNGIDLSDLTLDCSFLTDQLQYQDQNLKNLMDILLKSQCTLKQAIDELTEKISESEVFDTACLSIAVVDPKQSDILQAAIYKICADSGRLDDISADYVKASQLNQLIQDYLNSISSGGDTGIQWNTRMVPYVAYPYHGPISNFDSTGEGFANLGFGNVYVCNGSNGTPDYRGRTPIGANLNVPGLTLPAQTNPTLPANADYGIGLNATKGEYTHSLINAENAPHTHTVSDPGHFHYEFANVIAGSLTSVTSATQPSKGWQSTGGNDNEYQIDGSTTGATVGRSSTQKANVSVASSGSGRAHNTLHPVMGTNFIIYIPS